MTGGAGVRVGRRQRFLKVCTSSVFDTLSLQFLHKFPQFVTKHEPIYSEGLTAVYFM